jgi:hypothetical protein
MFWPGEASEPDEPAAGTVTTDGEAAAGAAALR